nr:MAG TPA: hypothetical protein [Caudoviricetes sp.]
MNISVLMEEASALCSTEELVETRTSAFSHLTAWTLANSTSER